MGAQPFFAQNVRNKMKKISLFVLSCLLLPLFAIAQTADPSINIIDGAQIVSKSTPLQTNKFLGRKTLVMFWKYDCPPCRVEMLEFDKTRAALGKIPVILIIPKFTKLENSALQPAIKGGATIAIIGNNYSDVLGDLGDAEGGVPYSVLFNEKGKACIANLGPTNAKIVKDMVRQCQ